MRVRVSLASLTKALAQLEEHLLCKQEVTSSSLVCLSITGNVSLTSKQQIANLNYEDKVQVIYNLDPNLNI